MQRVAGWGGNCTLDQAGRSCRESRLGHTSGRPYFSDACPLKLLFGAVHNLSILMCPLSSQAHPQTVLVLQEFLEEIQHASLLLKDSVDFSIGGQCRHASL